ncbi:MAG: hypothetical protein MJZ81_06055 [Bacteroidales bacterium]|nr:hypothetical protein [Bacteroidales bacterium]
METKKEQFIQKANELLKELQDLVQEAKDNGLEAASLAIVSASKKDDPTVHQVVGINGTTIDVARSLDRFFRNEKPGREISNAMMMVSMGRLLKHMNLEDSAEDQEQKGKE